MSFFQRHVLPISLGIVAAVLAPSAGAGERTAYIFRQNDDSVLTVPIPSEPPGMPILIEPDFHGPIDWAALGSALRSDEAILSLDLLHNSLVSYDLATGSSAPQTTIDRTLLSEDEIAVDPDGLVLLSGNELFRVDTQDGSVEPMAQMIHSFNTITYHRGAYYCGNAPFSRVDPTTFEVTLIGHYGGCPLVGLSSDGTNLWYMQTCIGGNGTGNSIGMIDVTTGLMTPYVGLNNTFLYEYYLAIEVVEQPDNAIPTLRPIGLLLVTVIIALAGVFLLTWGIPARS